MNPRVIAALALVSTLAAGEASAQGPITAAAGARIDSIFSPYDGPFPGCALGVYSDGAVVLARGYGKASMEYGVPIVRETPFFIGSLAMQFTAAAVILLEQQGRLSSGDDVRRHLPGLPDYAAGVTIDELMHHTSGLRDYQSVVDLAAKNHSFDISSNDGVLRMLSRQHRLNFSPGSRFMYSNTNYALLATVVDKASGAGYRRFIADQIFRPLGMTSTQDAIYVRPVRGLAEAYSRGPDGVWHMDDHPYGTTYGDAGLVTTIDDLARWDRNFTAGTVGGPTFLARQVELGRLADGTVLEARPGNASISRYAAGLFLGEYRGLATVEHSGNQGSYRSGMIRFPTVHTSVALLCNNADADPIALLHRVADVVLESAFTAPPPGPTAPPAAPPVMATKAAPDTSEKLMALAGIYYSTELRANYEIKVAGNQMILLRESPPPWLLIPQADGSFRWRGTARLDFLPAAQDGRPRFTVGDGGAFGIEFVKKAR